MKKHQTKGCSGALFPKIIPKSKVFKLLFILGTLSSPISLYSFSSIQINAQKDIKITGKIVDETNSPVEGASIKVKDGKQTVSSDGDGNFSLTAPASSTLIVSHLTFDTQEVQVNNRTKLTITLRSSGESLDEVVVIGYGTIKRSENTGSITSVKGAKIAEKPDRKSVV